MHVVPNGEPVPVSYGQRQISSNGLRHSYNGACLEVNKMQMQSEKRLDTFAIHINATTPAGAAERAVPGATSVATRCQISFSNAAAAISMLATDAASIVFNSAYLYD